jgi:hypothetical protein
MEREGKKWRGGGGGGGRKKTKPAAISSDRIIIDLDEP